MTIFMVSKPLVLILILKYVVVVVAKKICVRRMFS